jgi:hypothetical protein
MRKDKLFYSINDLIIFFLSYRRFIDSEMTKRGLRFDTKPVAFDFEKSDKKGK